MPSRRTKRDGSVSTTTNTRTLQRRMSKRKVVKTVISLNKNIPKVNKNVNKVVEKKGTVNKKLNNKILPLPNVNDTLPNYGLNRLGNDFFDVPCEDLAKGLLGKILVRQLEDGTVLKGRIVETECYPGGDDKASVSYNGRITDKIRALYMEPGAMFVYVTYGMYHCFNISSQGPGAGVLLRALEPLEGMDYMQQQRQKARKKNVSTGTKANELKLGDLCNGPAKLCMSFNITKTICNEQNLTTWDGMWVEEDQSNPKSVNSDLIVTSHRIGIDSVGKEWASKQLRFYLLGNSSVSRIDKTREEELKKKSKC